MAEKLNFPLGKWHSLAYTCFFIIFFIPSAPKIMYGKKGRETKTWGERDGGNITFFLIQLFNFNN